MFENITAESILDDMISKVKEYYPGIDTREGSVICVALAPAATELAQIYMALDIFMGETFADTASRHHLIKRCAERGIIPEEATRAIVQGEFVPETIDLDGKRFNCGDLNYVATEKIEDGVYRLQCETAGTIGNVYGGMLIPIEYIDGLKTARITDCLIPGEEEEDTEALRQRYFDSLDSQSFGGNVSDYKKKVNALDGVGGVKVYPTWNGGGTVKLCIISSDFGVPSGTLIDEVQTVVDPTQNQGDGLGIAPIGHAVTVTGVTGKEVNIEVTITYAAGWSWSNIETSAQEVIDQYFSELAETWEDSEYLVVRISQIETRLLSLEGVIDVADATLNSIAKNLTLGADEIPVRGDMVG